MASVPQIRLAEDNGISLDAYRFETLDILYELAVPSSLPGGCVMTIPAREQTIEMIPIDAIRRAQSPCPQSTPAS